jgi:hypothetical protein
MADSWQFGNRATIAARFTPLPNHPAPYGFVELWVGGDRLGMIDEPVFLFGVLGSLEWLADGRPAPQLADLIHQLDTTSAWAAMEAADWSFRFSPIEFFDNDHIHVARDDKSARLLWRSALEPHAPLKDKRIDIADVKVVASGLRTLFDSWHPPAAQSG